MLTTVMVLAISLIGWLNVQSRRDSLQRASFTKAQLNIALMDNNRSHKKDEFDDNEPASIGFENYLNRQTPEYTARTFMQSRVRETPISLLNYILQMKDAQLQRKFLAYALELWHNNAPSELQEWETSVQVNNAMTVFCGKEVFAPQLCVQYAQKIVNAEKQNNIIGYQLQHWAAADADAAIAWVLRADDSYERFGVDVFRYLVEFEFDTALFALSQLSDRDLSTSTKVADLIVKKLYQSQSSVQSNPSAVANAALSLSDSNFKDMLLLSLAPVLFQGGDTYNSMVLLDAMTDGPARDSLQHNFVSRLTEQQGAEAALRYLQQLSDDVQKRELIGSVIIRWSRDDIVAAHDWFKTWGNPLAETSLSLAQVAIDQQNIPIAIDLLDGLKNTPDNTLETADHNFQLAKLMYSDDPDSAIKYLESSLELSIEDKKALIAYLINTQNSYSESEPDLPR